MCMYLHMYVLMCRCWTGQLCIAKPACSEDGVADSPVGVVTGSMLSGHSQGCWRAELFLTPALPTEASPQLLIVCLIFIVFSNSTEAEKK